MSSSEVPTAEKQAGRNQESQPSIKAPAANRQPPEDTARDTEPESFGTWLRRQRVVRDIDLREIADASKIGIRYLQAFEDNRFDILPAPVFAKGFLRQYARYVGLEPEEVVNFYQTAREANESQEEPVVTERPRNPHSVAVYLLFLVAALALIALVWGLSVLAERQPSPAPELTPPPTVQPAAEPPPTTATLVPQAPPEEVPLRVVLDFRDECWIEAMVDGEPTISEIRVQGESLQLTAEREVEIHLGNARAAEIEVNGIPYVPRGTGSNVQRLHIDLETARTLAETQASPPVSTTPDAPLESAAAENDDTAG